MSLQQAPQRAKSALKFVPNVTLSTQVARSYLWKLAVELKSSTENTAESNFCRKMGKKDTVVFFLPRDFMLDRTVQRIYVSALFLLLDFVGHKK